MDGDDTMTSPVPTAMATPPPSSPRRAVASWALWDWGSSAYSTIVVSFVFAPYIAESVGGPDAALGLSGTTWLGISTALSGVLIAVLAPVTGQRADAGGRRRASLAVFTALVVISTLGLFFVRDAPAYLWLGLVLMAAGSVFLEFAYVSYNAMLHQISTPATIGRISGIGWGSGYLGGIVVLLAAYLLFIAPEVGLFGVTDADGLRYRALAIVVAVWFAVFAIPVLVTVPEVPATETRRTSFAASYRKLVADVRELFRTDRHVVWFLLASAIYRDGLAAVFTFGAVLAVSVYGLTASGVVIFGVVANVVAAVGAFAGGLLEDRVGPKPIIMTALTGLVVSSTVLLFASGPTMFWIFGLALTLWVGPAQASSRSFLAQLSTIGREGQLFGLYATTGRAVSFLAPALVALLSGAFGADRMGIVGIAVVLLAGAVWLVFVKPPPKARTSAWSEAS